MTHSNERIMKRKGQRNGGLIRIIRNAIYMNSKKYVLMYLASVLFGGSLLFASVAVAQTTGTPPPTGNSWGGRGGQKTHMMGGAPGVFGTVSAISGTTLTVTSKTFGPRPGSTTSGSGAAQSAPTQKTYTVDASSATVTKNNAASSVSAIAVGDTVMVQGTISGTSVSAKMIRDGVVQQMGAGMPGKGGGMPNSIIKGNGEPVIGGSVSAVSGSNLTVTNTSNVTYSVDASNAVVEKGNATSSISAIAVGDNVIVQGTVSGQSVTASSVMDQGAKPGSNSGSGSAAKPMGILGAIGGFFQHLFGFF